MKKLLFIAMLINAAWILPEVYVISVLFNKITVALSVI